MFARYVAIGDSTTEGIDDPDGAGGYRGWANRFAELMAEHNAGLLYANLAVRGLRTAQIRAQQLDRALAMRPDIATVVSGTNDVLRPTFEPRAYERDVRDMQAALIAQGATVLTFTLPDLSRINPIARLVSARVHTMNAVLRAVSAETGAIVLDLAAEPIAVDPRLWSHDRLHANALGHARIAQALAEAVALPRADASWRLPLGAASLPTLADRVASEVQWTRDFLAPWVMRRFTGRSSGDGRACKRPELRRVQ